MGKLKLDLSGYKYHSSTKSSTTLRHNKLGHKVVLAHNVLSDDNRTVLEALNDSVKKQKEFNDKKESHGKVVVKDEKPQPLGKVDVRDDIYKSKKLQDKNDLDKDDSEDEYAEGGKVERIERVDKQKAKDMVKGAMSGGPTIAEGLSNIKKELGFAKGGNVQQYAEGYLVEKNPFEIALEESRQPEQPIESKPYDFSNLGQNLSSSLEQANEMPSILKDPVDQQKQQILAKEQQAAQAVDEGPKSAIGQQQTDRQPASIPTEGVAVKPTGIDSSSDPMNIMREGLNQEMAGINQAANVQAQQGKEQQIALAKAEQSINTLNQTYMQTQKDLESQVKARMDDMNNGYIDPNKYWTGYTAPNGDKVPGHSKIAAGIGMILAGFNPTSNPNAVTEMLNKQMDQSLNAQAKNLDSQHNLLRANLDQYKNVNDAVTASKMMMNEALQHQIAQAAAKSAGPMAKAQAEQAIGKLKADYGIKFRTLAASQTLMKLANGNDPAALDEGMKRASVEAPEAYKEIKDRYVPGVGLASVPVPDKIREQLTQHQTLNNTVADAMNFAKQHTTLNPLSEGYAQSTAKGIALQAQVREALLNTVYRDSEKDLLEDLSPRNLGGIFKKQTLAKLKTISENNIRSLNDIKHAVGLKSQLSVNANPDAAARAWALDPKNATDPRAKEILKRQGQ